MILEPMCFPQQRIEHRRFVDMREDDAKMRAKLAMTGPEQKCLDMLGGGGLLQPTHHRALASMLGGLQDPQRFAARPIAEQQCRAKQILPMTTPMHVHRASH